MKTKHIIGISVALLALTALAWKFDEMKNKGKTKSSEGKGKKEPVQKDKPETSNYDQPVEQSRKTVRPDPKGDEFPLRLGSYGKHVERLEVWLMRNFGHTGIIRGEFDEKTLQQLMKYLKFKELDKNTYFEFGMNKPVHQQKIAA